VASSVLLNQLYYQPVRKDHEQPDCVLQKKWLFESKTGKQPKFEKMNKKL
jgi:hypothetical protein